jgi:hypothetical protein
MGVLVGGTGVGVLVGGTGVGVLVGDAGEGVLVGSAGEGVGSGAGVSETSAVQLDKRMIDRAVKIKGFQKRVFFIIPFQLIQYPLTKCRRIYWNEYIFGNFIAPNSNSYPCTISQYTFSVESNQ